MKAYAAQKKLSQILLDLFKGSLPDAEDTVLNETDPSDQLRQKALDMNVKGVDALIMAHATPEMVNKIMLEQQSVMKWQNIIFSNMWAAILADELLEDAVTEMEVEDDLRKLKLPNDKRIPRTFQPT